MQAQEKILAYLISEDTTYAQPKIITEPNKKSMVQVETVLQDESNFNRNGRRYPKPVLDLGLNKPNVRELISKKSWVGEAGHPNNPSLQRQVSIDPTNISHRIVKWWWDGPLVMGICEALNTERGRDYQNLILQELETAYSLRAVGPIKQTPEGNVVQSPLTVITYDWVFLPSHANAYQRGIINDVSENTRGNMMSESYCMPILEQQAIAYVKDESKTVKLVSETLGFCYESIALSENNNTIILTESTGNKLVVNLESYISTEVSSYLSKFK